MAVGEVTGADEEKLAEMESEYYTQPLYQEHNVPFEVAYCLVEIGKQPEEYDGPQRYCMKRVNKIDDYDGHKYDEEAFGHCCRFHGGVKQTGDVSHLDNPLTAAIKHGHHAEDEHLIMDFTDDEQELYDSIMNDWPEIYNWPDRSEDPARYRILRRVAVNEVRAIREEDYIDNHEVHQEPVFDEQGVEVGHKDAENPLSREYRLLMSEVTNQMKELGLTPKERQKMDTLEAREDKDSALTDIAGDAIGGDGDYDPEQFEDG
jgi:hypothetical protein